MSREEAGGMASFLPPPPDSSPTTRLRSSLARRSRQTSYKRSYSLPKGIFRALSDKCGGSVKWTPRLEARKSAEGLLRENSLRPKCDDTQKPIKQEGGEGGETEG